jgi:hypothetical protein
MEKAQGGSTNLLPKGRNSWIRHENQALASRFEGLWRIAFSIVLNLYRVFQPRAGHYFSCLVLVLRKQPVGPGPCRLSDAGTPTRQDKAIFT